MSGAWTLEWSGEVRRGPVFTIYDQNGFSNLGNNVDTFWFIAYWILPIVKWFDRGRIYLSCSYAIADSISRLGEVFLYSDVRGGGPHPEPQTQTAHTPQSSKSQPLMSRGATAPSSLNIELIGFQRGKMVGLRSHVEMPTQVLAR